MFADNERTVAENVWCVWEREGEKGKAGCKVCIYQMWQPFRRRELFKCFVCAMRGKREEEIAHTVLQVFYLPRVCACTWCVCVCVDNIVITKRVCDVNNSIKHVSRRTFELR